MIAIDRTSCNARFKLLTSNGSGLLQQVLERSASGSGRLPPCNFAAPELIGEVKVGATVSARPGVWAGLPIPEVRTTLLVDGVARPSPYLIGPDDDGREIVAADVATNDSGEATVSSPRILVQHPMPQALDVPDDVSISTEAIAIDAGTLFLGASGGQWSATCTAGSDAPQLEIDDMGCVTLAAGTLVGSAIVNVRYANSGGYSSAIFTVSTENVRPADAPKYDGSLGNLSITAGEPVLIEAGLAFSGDELLYSASGLPDGVFADPKSGRITGQTNQVGSYDVSVMATNAAGSVDAGFQLAIVEKIQPLPDAPSYDGSLPAKSAVLDSPFELSAGRAFTGEGLTFAATGLPPDLSIDATSGGISGTISSVGEFSITVVASNAGGDASGMFSLTVTKSAEGPTYIGGLDDWMVNNDTGDQFLNLDRFFTGVESYSFIANPDPNNLTLEGSILKAATNPMAALSGSLSVRATNAGGVTDHAFVFTNAEAEIGLKPTYDGGMDAGLGPWPTGTALTYATSRHAAGGDLRYEMIGLPEGLSLNTSTGDISGTPAAEGTTSATWTVANPFGAIPSTFDIAIGEASPEIPIGETDGKALSATDMSTNKDSGTAFIGAEDAARRVFCIVFGGAIENSRLNVSGDTVLLASDIYSARYAEAREITGLKGTEIDWSLDAAGNQEYIGFFRSIGYKPVQSSDAFISDRQPSNNTYSTTINITIPENGAVCFFGKKYNGVIWGGPGTPIVTGTSSGGANGAVRGTWENSTNAPQTFDITFTTSSSSGSKFGGALILEAE